MYLGLDLSLTGTGISLLEENYVIVKQAELSTKNFGAERLFHLELKFLEFLENYKTDIKFCIIEGAAYRAEGKIYELGQWAGIVQLNLFKLGIPFMEVAPLAVKKYIHGKGEDRGKNIVILDIYKNYGLTIENNNIADAYLISRIAYDFYNIFLIKKAKDLDLKKYQTEVLNKLFKDVYTSKTLF